MASALVVVLTGSLALETAAAAFPGEPVRLGLTPVGSDGPYFDLTLTPGETRLLRVDVANFGVDVVKARTYAADAYSMVNGGFAAVLFGAPRSGTSRWLAYPNRQMTLDPGEVDGIDFTVTVPPATLPGAYVASIVAENVNPSRGSGAIALDEVNRVAIAVAIEIPGASRPAIRIGAVGHKVAGGLSFLSFAVANPGNVHLKPVGRLVLRDGRGAQLVATGVAMDSVYAGMETRLEVALSDALRPGDYCAELRLTDPNTKATDATACLPFTVAVSTGDEAAGAGRPGGANPQTISLVQGAIDAATGQPGAAILTSGLFVALVLFLIAFLIVMVRRRRARDRPPAR
jgi:hypothetical protein